MIVTSVTFKLLLVVSVSCTFLCVPTETFHDQLLNVQENILLYYFVSVKLVYHHPRSRMMLICLEQYFDEIFSLRLLGARNYCDRLLTFDGVYKYIISVTRNMAFDFPPFFTTQISTCFDFSLLLLLSTFYTGCQARLCSLLLSKISRVYLLPPDL